MKLLIFLSLLVLAVLGDIQTEDNVYVLTEANFDEFVNAEPFTVVEFYAPWCGHCKKLAPEYSRAAATLGKNTPPIKLAKVDCTVEKSLGERFGVKGYPTLKIFRQGQPSDYNGPRQEGGIVKYVLSKTGPDATALPTAEDLEKFTKNAEASIIYFGDSDAKDSTETARVFWETAAKFRENFRFAHAKSTGEFKDQIVFFQGSRYLSKLEPTRIPFQGSSSAELAHFIESHAVPIAGEFTGGNSHLYRKLKKPLVRLFVDVDWEKNEKGVNYYLNRLRKVAIENELAKGLSFAVSDKKIGAKELAGVGLEKVKEPFFIHDLETDAKYLPEDPSFSLDNLKQFVQLFSTSKPDPYVKSQPIPQSQDEDVKTVVGKTFKSAVLESDDDVILFSYSPTSQPSKTFQPKFEELAKKLRKVETLTFAKIDGIANDVPKGYSTTSYPTLFLAPANKKDQPIKYTGKLEVNDVLKFIKSNVHHPLPLKKSAKGSDDKEL